MRKRLIIPTVNQIFTSFKVTNIFSLKTLLFSLSLCLFLFDLNAQCPVPASCTPGGPTGANSELFNMGIRRVTINNINKTSSFINSVLSVSYHDYSCTDSTSLTLGIPYNITVVTNGNPPTGTQNENVRVWIDYNNDGSFTSNELAFSSNNKQTHTGSVNIPGTAITDIPLRMRVASEWVGAGSSIPTPCGNREYSEVEDYQVIVRVNSSAPTTDFTANPRTSCDGAVQFQDLSINGPTSWFWDFGDGNTSTAQNPQHNYAISDTFDVTLIAINANGADTLTKTDYIIRTGFTPPSASCTPITNAYCCGYGIRNFQLEDINNSSSDASVGYEDFTCSAFTHLIEGLSYPISFTTSSTSPENIKMYLDLNANGSFQDPGELIYSANNVSSPTANVIIPAAQAPYSQPLRLRVMSDAIGSSFNSCSNLTRGQAEDYTVIIDPNPFPPVANFLDNQINACQDSITFTDNSINAPQSWFWDFGDGDTSILQNPAHKYTANGTFTVKLVVTNSNGSDSSSRNFTVSDGARPPACIPNTLQTFFPLGIERVEFNTINNTTSSAPNFPPYEDFACDFVTTVTQGQTINMTVVTQSNFTPSDVKAWLDYNDNGIFESNEEIFNSNNLINHTAPVTISSASSVVTGTGLRLRIASDFVNSINGPIPCGDLEFGQTEDYSVIINAPSLPPTADFNVSSFTSCSGDIDFTDASGFGPTQWFWDFGDGSNSTLQNPNHLYTSVGSFFVELKACNSFGCDSIQKTISITDLNGVKPISCTPGSNSTNANIGIFNVTFNDLNVSSAPNNSYSDYSCDKFAELVDGNAYQLNVTVGTFNNHTVEAWIDFNNSGTFTSNEKVFTDDGFGVLSNVVILPANAVKNEFLRMRVITNSTASGGSPFNPCNNVTVGEIEDYGVLIRTANAIPIADFESLEPNSCNGEIAFINNSYNNPTNYLWDFGDGNSSILENPVHRYSSPGAYNVKLRVQNGFGQDSLVRLVYAVVSQVQDPIAASCYPMTEFSNPDFGIVGVNVASISNSNTVVDGYENYTCTDTAHVNEGQNYSIQVITSNSIRANVRAYVDFNNDGIFQDPSELILLSNNRLQNHVGTLTVPSGAVKNRILRMRIWADAFNVPLPTSIPCTNPEYGQVEDYGILIRGSVSLASEIEDEISIYPNPADDRLFLTLPEQLSQSRITVVSNVGREIFTLNSEGVSERIEIPLDQLNSGLYLLKIESKDFSKTLKFIKK